MTSRELEVPRPWFEFEVSPLSWSVCQDGTLVRFGKDPSGESINILFELIHFAMERDSHGGGGGGAGGRGRSGRKSFPSSCHIPTDKQNTLTVHFRPFLQSYWTSGWKKKGYRSIKKKNRSFITESPILSVSFLLSFTLLVSVTITYLPNHSLVFYRRIYNKKKTFQTSLTGLTGLERQIFVWSTDSYSTRPFHPSERGRRVSSWRR